ncbi:hypothetical protein [Azospirillum canadense]|uniref:hypothetical protein n=1 Tax=Azospirillum canadense TaxID=403962 RepID=UPI0022261A47|nr:hypothetical protein [Azospirillum canadense]MCW2240727.1 hypothetical protein [Azospirillum canadense]
MMNGVPAMTTEATIRKRLGGDPALEAIGMFVILATLGPAATIALWWAARLTGVDMLVALVWVFALVVAITLPALLLRIPGAIINRMRWFRPAVEAVMRGKIGASWAVQGRNGAGVVVVDEPERRLWVSGDVVGFEEVREVDWSTTGKRAFFRIVLTNGKAPVMEVQMDNHAAAMQAGQRLINALEQKSGGNSGGLLEGTIKPHESTHKTPSQVP